MTANPKPRATSSPAANRRKGAAFETALVEYFRRKGEHCERLPLTGALDEGDLYLLDGGEYTVIEAKNAAMDPAGFTAQARLEARNFAAKRGLPIERVQGIVIVKRRGKGVGDSYVLTTLDEYFGYHG